MDSAAKFIENAETECGLGKLCTQKTPHRGICPENWHVPTSDEFDALLTFIGGSSYAGMELKSTSLWVAVNESIGDISISSKEGIDRVGFTALPAGYLTGKIPGRLFYDMGGEGSTYFWSATENKTPASWEHVPYQFAVYYTITHISNDVTMMSYSKSDAYSLRCVKD